MQEISAAVIGIYNGPVPGQDACPKSESADDLFALLGKGVFNVNAERMICGG